jgi:hypothetical protein
MAHRTRSTALIACLAIGSLFAPVHGAEPENSTGYTPKAFQAGKDVVWVPTHGAVAEAMLDLVRLRKSDYLVDLGSGDGVTVIAAARRGARAHGIEYNPDLVELARRNAQREGVADRATFVQGDIFESDFSDATVVSLFLLQRLNLQLRPTLLDMKPGTRIVSNTFDMGDWKPDGSRTVRDCQSFCRAYAWVVPAKVEGVWQMGDRELTLTQSFQFFEGELRKGDEVEVIGSGKLEGSRISFNVGRRRYVGEVKGDVIEGAAGGPAWSARKLR